MRCKFVCKSTSDSFGLILNFNSKLFYLIQINGREASLNLKLKRICFVSPSSTNTYVKVILMLCRLILSLFYFKHLRIILQIDYISIKFRGKG